MNKRIKKILTWTISIIGIGIVICIALLVYAVYSLMSGCSIFDGPFNAVLIDQTEFSKNLETFELKDNGVLILDNRTNSLSPTLTLKENGVIKWTLEIETGNTKGYEGTRIWKISNVTITENTDTIKLYFTGYWTRRVDRGSMEINRDNGENFFCLTW